MGTIEKVGLIAGTGGIAGTLLTYQSGAAVLGGSVVGGLVAMTTAVVADVSPATPEQVARVEGTAERILAKMPAKHREELKKKKIKHIAVATKPSKSSRGTAAVMVYDIEKRKVAKPVVFDVRVTPEVGSTVQFDTFVTEYVGTGEDTSL